jgi:hypothetical protein
LHLTVGEVIRWDDFPYPRSGKQKARWFIYLGRSTTLSFPVLRIFAPQQHNFNILNEAVPGATMLVRGFL